MRSAFLLLILILVLAFNTSAFGAKPKFSTPQLQTPQTKPSSRLCLDWTKFAELDVNAELIGLEGDVGYVATSSELLRLIRDDVARINSFSKAKRPSHTREIEVAAGLLIYMKEKKTTYINLRTLRFPVLPEMVSATKCDPTEACPEDIDGNGHVDFADFLELSENYGRRVDPAGTDGDINGDGWVNFADFLRLAAWLDLGCNPYAGSD